MLKITKYAYPFKSSQKHLKRRSKNDIIKEKSVGKDEKGMNQRPNSTNFAELREDVSARNISASKTTFKALNG